MRYYLIPEISCADLVPVRKRQLFMQEQTYTRLFSQGRVALRYGVELVRQEAGLRNEILVPAYICEETLMPLRDAGFTLVYYPVTAGLECSLSEVSALFTPRTLALIVVHYFGLPQKGIFELKELCCRHHVRLIEDCAHVLWSRINEKNVGTIGDLAFFSYRKFFPVPDGAMLAINDPALLKTGASYGPSRKSSRNVFELALRAIVYDLDNKYSVTLRPRLRRGDASIEQMCPRADIKLERRRFVDQEGISQYSKNFLARYDYQAVRQRRVENYTILADRLRTISSLTLVFDCAGQSWIPYVLPVMVPAQLQFALIRALIHAGIVVTDWPTLPIDLSLDRKQAAELLQKSIILFPVHQNISRREMDRISALARNIIVRELA